MKISALNQSNSFGGRLKISNSSYGNREINNVELVAQTPQTFKALSDAFERIDEEAKKHESKLPYYNTNDLKLQLTWSPNTCNTLFRVAYKEGNKEESYTNEAVLPLDVPEAQKIQIIKEFADSVCYKISGKYEENAEKLLNRYV